MADRLLPIIKLFRIYLNINCLPYILSHGFGFCIPPLSVKRQNVFLEFKVYFAWISKLSSHPSDNVWALKPKLNYLTFDVYAGTPFDYDEFKWQREHFHVISSLRLNKSLIITKSDKSDWMVVLDYDDYINSIWWWFSLMGTN